MKYIDNATAIKDGRSLDHILKMIGIHALHPLSEYGVFFSKTWRDQMNVFVIIVLLLTIHFCMNIFLISALEKIWFKAFKKKLLL